MKSNIPFGTRDGNESEEYGVGCGLVWTFAEPIDIELAVVVIREDESENIRIAFIKDFKI